MAKKQYIHHRSKKRCHRQVREVLFIVEKWSPGYDMFEELSHATMDGASFRLTLLSGQVFLLALRKGTDLKKGESKREESIF